MSLKRFDIPRLSLHFNATRGIPPSSMAKDDILELEPSHTLSARMLSFMREVFEFTRLDIPMLSLHFIPTKGIPPSSMAKDDILELEISHTLSAKDVILYGRGF